MRAPFWRREGIYFEKGVTMSISTSNSTSNEAIFSRRAIAALSSTFAFAAIAGCASGAVRPGGAAGKTAAGYSSEAKDIVDSYFASWTDANGFDEPLLRSVLANDVELVLNRKSIR